PIDSGLPVTTPDRCSPVIIDSVSINHAITRPSVFTSGAGTSRSGPSNGDTSYVYRRVNRSSSPRLSFDGSHRTPPFAPPNGRSTIAVLNVIDAASAF